MLVEEKYLLEDEKSKALSDTVLKMSSNEKDFIKVCMLCSKKAMSGGPYPDQENIHYFTPLVYKEIVKMAKEIREFSKKYDLTLAGYEVMLKPGVADTVLKKLEKVL